MFEIDFLPVGDGGRSGDAIAIRFTRPDTGAPAHVVVDAGFEDDGEGLVEHVNAYYETTSIDLAILTHPDGDHIGGMGEVLRGLSVKELWLHDLGARGGTGLPAADAVDDLIEVAREQGTVVREAFAGASAFGDALLIIGPTVEYYEQLVAAEQEVAKSAEGRAMRFGAPVSVRMQRFLAALPVEVPFGDAGGTSPRNNSSMITLLQLDEKQLLLTADAGVPALDRALDWVEAQGAHVYQPRFVQLPHHGSRHNASSEFQSASGTDGTSPDAVGVRQRHQGGGEAPVAASRQRLHASWLRRPRDARRHKVASLRRCAAAAWLEHCGAARAPRRVA